MIVVPQVARLRQGAVRLASLLLVAYERGHRISSDWAEPPRRDRARHAETTGSPTWRALPGTEPLRSRSRRASGRARAALRAGRRSRGLPPAARVGQGRWRRAGRAAAIRMLLRSALTPTPTPTLYSSFPLRSFMQLSYSSSCSVASVAVAVGRRRLQVRRRRSRLLSNATLWPSTSFWFPLCYVLYPISSSE